MEEHILTENSLIAFKRQLQLEEKSDCTVKKYIRDVGAFLAYVKEKEITKETVISFKQHLICAKYAVRSVNSMISALNCFFSFLGWYDCRIKLIKVQQRIYCPEEEELSKAEYSRLCQVAERRRNNRISLIMQTICSTGIRVSELRYITVEAVKCSKAVVDCKAKTRVVFLVRDLRKKLLRYISEHKIKSGPVFVTRTGKPLCRVNIWREMKRLCEEAKVNPHKVFPHSLRHLFARVFYGMEKDIAKLADILGHSSINTTRIYIISTGEEHRKCMENMRLVI